MSEVDRISRRKRRPRFRRDWRGYWLSPRWCWAFAGRWTKAKTHRRERREGRRAMRVDPDHAAKLAAF